MTKPYILFYSKSKAALERRLSNFYPAPVTYEGATFPSIENAFQAAKYLHSTRPDLFATLASMTPSEAKSAGSKSGMKRRGAVLADLDAWNAKSVGIMKRLVKARTKTDDLYRKILLKARREGVAFLHFERSCGKSFWGGCFRKGSDKMVSNFVGNNMLGKILSGSV